MGSSAQIQNRGLGGTSFIPAQKSSHRFTGGISLGNSLRRQDYLRRSFIRSPGEYSEAPFDFDIPTVPLLSFLMSPGLNSDAPFVVGVFEFCIS
jgi:hypothetical protein